MADNGPGFEDEDFPDWLTPAESGSGANAEPPASKQPVRPLRKLGGTGAIATDTNTSAPPDADPNLTYEEWERRQTEQEQSALRTPEDDLLDAIPDWITAGTDVPTEDSDTGSGPELRPAWFSGLEEQSADDAPDWFKPDEIANTSLSGPMSRAVSASNPLPAADPAVPDWMRGTVDSGPGGSGAGMDFSDLFGSSAEEAYAVPEPEIGGVPLSDNSPVDDMALDWMSDLPDLPDFSAVERPLPDQSAEPVADLPVGESYDPFSGFDFPAADAPAATEAANSSPDEMPEWMRSLSADESPLATFSEGNAASFEDAAPAVEAGALPDWLSGLARPVDSESTGAAAVSQAGPEAAEAMPDWMNALQLAPVSDDPPSNFYGSSGASDQSFDVSSDDIDMLLNLPIPKRALQEPEPITAIRPTANFDSISLDSSDSNFDNLLEPALAAYPVAEAVPAPVAPAPPPPIPVSRRPGRRAPIAVPDGPATKGQIPDSVLERISVDVPVQFTIGPVQIAVQESSLAALSDQMRQLRDRAAAFKAPVAAPPATAGPLTAIAGTLAIEPVIVQAAAAPGVASAGAFPDVQRQRVALIRHILEMDAVAPAESVASARAASAARPATRIKADRLVITLLLLLALVVPFFTNLFNVVAPPDASIPTAEQTAVSGAIDAIGSGHVVLMAFEYGPTGATEMDDLARVLLRDLFRRGVKPVIVSTNFAGAMHADALLNSFGHNANELKAINRKADMPLVDRQDYVVLRYLPSGAAGVRSVVNAIFFGSGSGQSSFTLDAQTEFALDVEGQPSGLNLSTDLPILRASPAIVLAETSEDVRNWAEQYRTPAGVAPGTADTQIVLAVSAAAAATARAYSSTFSKTVIGPLIGLRDATLYALERQQLTPGSALDRLNQRWQSVGLGALVAAALILFGALFSLLGSLRRRGQSQRSRRAQAGARR